jgi:hypothetical protein
MELPLTFDTYAHKAKTVSSRMLINAYAQIQPKGSRARGIVIGSAGIEPWVAVGTGPIRGTIKMADVLYVVSGIDLWRVSESGQKTFIGSGIDGTQTVSMAQNGFEIVITNGGTSFSYLLSDGSFIQIVSPGIRPARTVTMLNSLFVWEEADTNQFIWSAVLDGRTIDPLSFASAETNSDRIVAVKAYNGVLYLFGTSTMEMWSHTGAVAQPFSAILGANIYRGLVSAKAIGEEDQSLFILSNDKVAYRITGQGVTPISTPQQHQEWTSFKSVSDCEVFTMSFEGHKFIHYVFPSANKSYTYDLTTNLWHERQSYTFNNEEVRWRVNGAIDVYQQVIVSDSQSNQLGKLNPDIYTEFGVPILTTMVTPPLFDQGLDIPIDRLELDMETGYGAANGAGSNPKIMAFVSKDHGHNWHTMGEASLGKIGEYQQRCRWSQLGFSKWWAFKFQISDPVRRTFVGFRIPPPQ